MNYLSLCSGIEAASPYMRDMTGVRNGRLVVVKFAGRHKKDGRATWLCDCDCGQQKIVAQNNLSRSTGTKSCGCLRSEASKRRRKRDGVWNDSKSYSINGGKRCYKTRHAWSKAAIRHYGNKCEKCGWADARCDVHHRTPKASGGLHTIINAIVLCPNCHRILHEKKGGQR